MRTICLCGSIDRTLLSYRPNMPVLLYVLLMKLETCVCLLNSKDRVACENTVKCEWPSALMRLLTTLKCEIQNSG